MKWIQFVKDYAKKNKMSYRDALKDPKCNELYRQTKYSGGGFVDEAVGMVTNAVNKQIDKVKNGKSYLVPPSLKTTLSKYADNVIVGATLYRHPVDAWIRKTLNVLGSNKTPFDKLFHLRLLLKLDNGKDIFIEKNERLNSGIGMGDKKEGLETMPIDSSDIPTGLTFGELVDKTKEYQGEKFLTYSSSSNNCQYFINAILQSNNFGNVSKYANFIKQDTESIFKNNPALRKIANTFTDLGANVNVLQNGGRLGNLRLLPHTNVMIHSQPEVKTTGGKIKKGKKDTLGKFRMDLKAHMNEDSKEQKEMNKSLKAITKLDREILKLLQ